MAPFIGSWLGVLIRRWPRRRPVALARSRCEQCGHVLGVADLVPLLSFAWLRGRCRYCGAGIGWFHPGVEAAALAIALVCLAVGGEGARPWLAAGLGWVLLCAAWIDAETMLLPDLLTLPLILAGLAVTWAERPSALSDHAAAAALGYLGFKALDAAYYRLRRRHGLGQGDAKLMAAAGAWLGAAALPGVILVAGLAGLAMALALVWLGRLARGAALPFGPALALAFFMLALAPGGLP
ncbi:prepilin peptidase [Acidocella sp.]|uniref:prepilin peptidase n=1 Tax=Acidocella sp. TaxID=50710 RepID=UPI003D092EF2